MRCLILIVVLFHWQCYSIEGTEVVPDIYHLHIKSDIRYRFATTHVTSKIANPGETSGEVTFSLDLPDNAFISNFTLELEGTVYPGVVKSTEQARQDYEKAKEQGQNAGIISQSPRDTNSFSLSVNVAAGNKVTFNLTYQELLQRRIRKYTHRIYVNPGQPVRELQIVVDIKESRAITVLKVPPLRNDLLTNIHNEGSNPNADITWSGGNVAQIKYTPTTEEQTVTSEKGLSGQFVVEYDVERGLDAGDVVVMNGYFVHYIAPLIVGAVPRDILFILDKSGSMRGQKMRQLKEAMFTILDKLQEQDRFNIITFSGSQSWLYPSLQAVNENTILSAKNKVEYIEANGGTNIYDSIITGIDELSNTAEERAPIIMFLTDGQATDGVTSNSEILSGIRQRNRKGIPVNTLAFGANANWDLLLKIALQNNGVARRIYTDSDSQFQIIIFYSEISVTLLKDVNVLYSSDYIDSSTVTRTAFETYYDGSEICVTGKFKEDNAVFQSDITGVSVSGEIQLQLVADEIIELDSQPFVDGMAVSEATIEKIWAYMTIKNYFRAIDTGDLSEEEENILTEKALDMSLKYNFVTRLTSMVVVIPEENRVPEPGDTAEDPPSGEMFSKNSVSAGGARGTGGVQNIYPLSANNYPTAADAIGGSDILHRTGIVKAMAVCLLVSVLQTFL